MNTRGKCVQSFAFIIYEAEYDYGRVSDLLSAAKVGDMIYLDQTLKPVQEDDEILIEIRCNTARAVTHV